MTSQHPTDPRDHEPMLEGPIYRELVDPTALAPAPPAEAGAGADDLDPLQHDPWAHWADHNDDDDQLDEVDVDWSQL